MLDAESLPVKLERLSVTRAEVAKIPEEDTVPLPGKPAVGSFGSGMPIGPVIIEIVGRVTIGLASVWVSTGPDAVGLIVSVISQYSLVECETEGLGNTEPVGLTESIVLDRTTL